MCCVLAVIIAIGPRVGLILWWILAPFRFSLVFDSIIWPILGVIFAPWTTLAWVFVGVNGVHGLDWILIAIGILADLASYGGSAYTNRDKVRKQPA